MAERGPESRGRVGARRQRRHRMGLGAANQTGGRAEVHCKTVTNWRLPILSRLGRKGRVMGPGYRPDASGPYP